MRKLLLLVFVFSFILYGQENRNYRGKQYGFAFSLAESGAAVSGYYRIPIGYNWTSGLLLDFHMMRDQNQVDIPNPYNPNYNISYNKQNNLYYISLYGDIKKRFWEDIIENTLRPFWVLGAGGIYGLNYPEKRLVYDQETGNTAVEQPPNEFELGYLFHVGFGVDISTGKDFTLSIRPMYKYIKFLNPISGRSDHSTIELRFEFGATKAGK